MSDGLLYCTDCYFMFYHDPERFEDMDCSNGNAVPWNGAPEIISSEPHTCPFFEKRTFEQKVEDEIDGMLYDIHIDLKNHHKDYDSALFWKQMGAIEYLNKLKEKVVK